MRMARNTKTTLAHFSLISLLLIFIMFIAFLLLVPFPAEPADKTFTLLINSKQVIVKLPDALPDMKTALYTGERCFDLIICMQQYCLPPYTDDHDHIHFFYANEAEVFCVIWTRISTQDYVVWKYVNGNPILSDLDEVKKIIGDIRKPKTPGI